MGGLSKWNVLRDVELSHALPEVFGPVPEVIVGLLREEAEKVWQAWNPVFWAVIKNRGYLGERGRLARLRASRRDPREPQLPAPPVCPP